MAPLFFLILFASLDAALWAVETSAAVAGAQEAARVAASAPGSTGANQQKPTNAEVARRVVGQLQQAMFGTKVVAAPEGIPCPTRPSQVAGSTLVVCVQTVCNFPCQQVGGVPQCPPEPAFCDPPLVDVHVVGYIASLVPPADSLGWRAGQIPLDVGITTHALRFAR